MSTMNEWKDLNESLKRTLLPRSTTIDERPFERADFETFTQTTIIQFADLELLLSVLPEQEIIHLKPIQLECVYRILLLCGEHSSPSLWTNDESVRRGESVLDQTLITFKIKDLSSFLITRDSRNQPHGVNLFLLLTPKLSKNEWKYYPAAVNCFSWFLHHIRTEMGEFLSLIIPVSLIIIDDFEIENKVIALRFLTHVLRYISSAELSWYLEIEVLENKIKPLLLYREANLILPLIECSLEVANKTTHLFSDAEDLLWGYMDDILTTLLPMMEYEQVISRRLAYSECLVKILNRTKVCLVRWCPEVLRIIDDYSKTSDTELAAMKALYSFTWNCWPFLGNHWRFVNVVAGRIVFRSLNKEAIEVAEKVLYRLECCAQSSFKVISIDDIRIKRKLLKSQRPSMKKL